MKNNIGFKKELSHGKTFARAKRYTKLSRLYAKDGEYFQYCKLTKSWKKYRKTQYKIGN